MKVRFEEEKTISIRNIIISDKEADKLLSELKIAIKDRKGGKDVPKIKFGDFHIIITNLM